MKVVEIHRLPISFVHVPLHVSLADAAQTHKQVITVNGKKPMLLGRQFGIVTSMVLLSVIFWGWVWGPIGMLLAVPITMLVKLGLESSKDLAWIAQLVDNPPVSRFPLPPRHSGKTNENINKE